MWLWILSALFLALVWGVWFILRPTPGLGGPSAEVFPTWIPIVVTAVVVVALIGLVVYRRIRAARAARALEKAIAQQAQEQALAAKPERRAEIQELHRQLQEGINALKGSKLGGGGNALYSLPWYVMVGPPGAGKTTALRHSGLVFPYLDPAGGGVRGVGGTRNCDWWFTNEAILLDTAGRYTTEADDHDEWMAFLEQLLKYRPEKPVNGVVVAVSTSELVDATEEQVASIANKVRSRIDEMQSTLKMVLPVYVLFTKVDLVSGFVEFFSDLKKSERGQGFGATVKLDSNKSEPGKIFDAEFDTMIERVHERTLRRMASERNRGAKEKIFQFPLELAELKHNMSEFLNVAFSPSKTAGLATPIMRGFYFTSGTQEGKPLDRVLGRMMGAFGLRPAVSDEPSIAGAAESKSYFLRDVFMNVIFPDQDIAARTAAEIRKQRFQRFAAAFAAALLAVLLLIPTILSFINNRALVAETSRISNEAANVKWGDESSPVEKVEKLDKLREHAQLLDSYREEGPPVGYRWGMYQGDKLFEPTKDQYIASLRDGFMKPVRARLEDRLGAATGGKYLEEYNDLKTYLLLADENKRHLLPESETAWLTGRLLQLWADELRPKTDIPEADLKSKLLPHVKYYVDLLRRGAIKGEDLDKPLVERTRDILARVGPTQRYYDRFVTVLEYEKYDENGPNTRENLKYPPISLDELFSDRPEVLSKIQSAQKQRTGKWYLVRGPYTSKGHAQVIASLEEGIKVLDRERWVVPLTQEEERQGDKIQQALTRVRQDYDAQYIREWMEFFRDTLVDIPPNNKEAIEEFRVLSTPDWPYQRLLRTLEDNTQFDVAQNEAQAAALADGGLLDQVKERVRRRVDSSFSTKTGTTGRVSSMINFGGGPGSVAYDPIPDKFRSMVRFGVPEAPKQQAEGVPPPPPTPAEISKYVGHLEQLAAEMGSIEDSPPGGANTANARQKFAEAVQETEKLLLKMDETGQELMTPLLMNPLRQAYKAVMRSAGGSASGLWEVVVAPPYEEKLKDRYPFDLSAARDASFEDAVAFLKPKDGILWGFYGQHLDPFHLRVGHDFIPKGGLEGRPKPAKPFTPFNAMLYPCLHRMHEITEALFSGGGPEDKPRVSFNINLKTVSPIVSEVLFEIDGQKRLYRNEKEFWHSFVWPGEKATGARLRVRGAGGLDEELVREGPWGIFRLFEAGTTTAVKDKDEVFTVTWQMTAPPVTVTMEVRPTRANHPFAPSFFRASNCPHSIGDSFGGGGGGGKKGS